MYTYSERYLSAVHLTSYRDSRLPPLSSSISNVVSIQVTISFGLLETTGFYRSCFLSFLRLTLPPVSG